MFAEDDLLPISALQHLLYCRRRAALVHVERLWSENRYTMEGRHVHDRAHAASSEHRRDVRIARGLRLHSFRLGLSGKADVVEFHRVGSATEGVSLATVAGRWQPFPVEYKRGRRRKQQGYEVQLCAQSLCIEEMLGVAVPAGALFYGKTRRRTDVVFDDTLRRLTEQAALSLHELIQTGATPPAEPGPKCKRCSLRESCLPEGTVGRSAKRYLKRMLEEKKREEP